MDENKAIEANAPAIAPEGEVKVTLPTEDDAEARIAQLEQEKANYQAAYLKEKSKNKEPVSDEDEKIARIVEAKLAESKINQIDLEKDEIYRKALKENKELKLAQLNKPDSVPTAMGVHSETQAVRDSQISPEQMNYFRSIGKNDKWIENYKRNLKKSVR